MLINCYKRYCFFSFFILCVSAYGQDIQNRLDSFSGKLITDIRNGSRLRAILTTDRSIFNAGETIWFKTWLINSVSQKVSSRSKYLFVDLVNENDNVVQTVLMDVITQQLNGKITLPAQIPEGYYWLRAYTRQMAEGDTTNCAVKPVYVINSKSAATNKNTISKPRINKQENLPVISFFPEGGSLITGANSTVAIRIYDKDENPIAIEGIIKDNLDSVTTRFRSAKNGLGKFSFSPSRYRKYKALITWNGKQFSYPLPAFNFNAGQLSITSKPGATRLVRVLLEDSIYSDNYLTYIVGISKDSFCFAGIGRGLYEISVPEQKFPEGIATFYLFNKDFKLLSERSIYINENLLVKASVDKNSYAKKSKVTLNFSITDRNQQPVPSLISIAVVDSLFSEPVAAGNLAGFNDKNNGKGIDNAAIARIQGLSDEDLDVLMLLKNNTYKPNGGSAIQSRMPVNKDSLLNIKGIVLNDKNEPAINKIVTLFSKSGNGVFETDTTDDNGRFYFPIEGYGDSTQITINVKSLKGRNEQTRVLIDSLHLPVFKTPVILKQPMFSAPVIAKYRHIYDDEFSSGDKVKLTPGILVSKKLVNYDQTKRVSQSSFILTSDNMAEGTSVGNAILGVSGLHLLNGFLVINGLTQMAAPNAGSEPLILVDGVQVSLSSEIGIGSPALGYLNSLNIKEVDFIEILKGADGANYGIRGGNGVILINMASQTKDRSKSSNNNFNVFYLKGIFNPTLFPVTDYSNKETTIEPAIDNRTTIFWNGSVLTGDGNATTPGFFTSEVPATYKVTISGMTLHGDIVYKTLTFQNQ